MNTDIFEKFGIDGTSNLSLTSFIFSIILSFILSFLLSKVYRIQSNTFSNPESLARIFPILSIGTTIIIAVVKSSLALSLGLVGALSIVRFRTPIKEPEELTYIFLCIGIGLATGADQYQVAIIGFLLTVLCIYLNKRFTSRINSQKNISLSITGINTIDISNIVELISDNCQYLNFHNLSTSLGDTKNINLTLSFTPKDFKQINFIVEKIANEYPNSSLNIIDNNMY